MTDKWVLILTDRQTNEVRRLEFDTREARAEGMSFDVHKTRYALEDPEEQECTP